MIEAYLYASCTSCRKTEDVLKERGADYVGRDYFKHRLSRHELSSILERANLTPHDVLSRRSKVYRARSEEVDALSDAALLDFMVKEPTLVRRPLVLGPAGVIIGHNPKKLDEMIAADRRR